jgi:hypothetical protein
MLSGDGAKTEAKAMARAINRRTALESRLFYFKFLSWY